MRRFAAPALLSFVFLGAAGCGGGGGDSPAGPSTPVVAAVTLTDAPATLDYGSTATLHASAADASGNAIANPTLSWETSDASVLSVDAATGAARAAGPGTATVTVHAGTKSAQAAVKVVLPVDTRAALASGAYHTCRSTGDVTWCWGRNADYQVGSGAGLVALRPVAVTGAPSLVSLAAGWTHSCGLTAAGAAYCWGSGAGTGLNGTGNALGTGLTRSTMTPLAVGGGLSFAMLAAGNGHTCGLTRDGEAYCWGDDAQGQAGDNGKGVSPTVPVRVETSLRFVRVAAAGTHSCALTAAGAAYCWGDNTAGDLGDGTTQIRGTPAAVTGGLAFTQLSLGYDSTCGLTAQGAVYCWGANDFGQLGIDSRDAGDHPAPVRVAGGVAFASLGATGNFHVCGIAQSGATYCWGDNSEGQLGDGTTTARLAPFPIAAPAGVVFSYLGGGELHQCGLTSAGATYCWGYNTHGEVGIGTATTYESTPMLVVYQ